MMDEVELEEKIIRDVIIEEIYFYSLYAFVFPSFIFLFRANFSTLSSTVSKKNKNYSCVCL